MSIADELQRLEALRNSGAITEHEYTLAKRRVLDGTPPPADTTPRPLTPPEPNVLHRFTRSDTDYWLGGVCGGLGEITPVPSWGWRLIFCVAALVS